MTTRTNNGKTRRESTTSTMEIMPCSQFSSAYYTFMPSMPLNRALATSHCLSKSFLLYVFYQIRSRFLPSRHFIPPYTFSFWVCASVLEAGQGNQGLAFPDGDTSPQPSISLRHWGLPPTHRLWQQASTPSLEAGIFWSAYHSTHQALV
jgi:hypothetical protein